MINNDKIRMENFTDDYAVGFQKFNLLNDNFQADFPQIQFA